MALRGSGDAVAAGDTAAPTTTGTAPTSEPEPVATTGLPAHTATTAPPGDDTASRTTTAAAVSPTTVPDAPPNPFNTPTDASAANPVPAGEACSTGRWTLTVTNSHALSSGAELGTHFPASTADVAALAAGNTYAVVTVDEAFEGPDDAQIPARDLHSSLQRRTAPAPRRTPARP
ncbi:MAG: hypothetical protein S0880_08710 [Actinomycetota bacterium]|nr:hypothetical protein [Actinomycetota bacterium]